MSIDTLKQFHDQYQLVRLCKISKVFETKENKVIIER